MKYIRIFKTHEEFSNAIILKPYVAYDGEHVHYKNYPTEPESDEIWYTTIDRSIVAPITEYTGAYGHHYTLNTDVQVIDNTYDKVGIVKFNKPITHLWEAGTLEVYGPPITLFGSSPYLQTVTFSRTPMESIGNLCLAYYASLEKVTFLGEVTTICSRAFARCFNLRSVTLNSVLWIENQAFEECSSLTELVLNGSYYSIYPGAFEGCSSLTSVTYNGVNYTSKSLLSDAMNIPVSAFNGTALLD